LTSPYPFFVKLRDPETLVLEKGIKERWIGNSSFQRTEGREFAFEFENFEIKPEAFLVIILKNLNKLDS